MLLSSLAFGGLARLGVSSLRSCFGMLYGSAACLGSLSCNTLDTCYCWHLSITFCWYLRFVTSHRCRSSDFHLPTSFGYAGTSGCVFALLVATSLCSVICGHRPLVVWPAAMFSHLCRCSDCYRLLPRIPPCAPLFVLALCLPLTAATLCFLTHLAPLVP